MGEMVASRSMQMLLHLADKYEYASGLVEDEVNELVLLLRKIEKLLINDGNSRKVTENIRKIRNLVYTIEDALETLAVKVEEVEFMPRKNEKKRGITRLLRKHFRRGDEGSRIILVMFMFVVKSIFEGLPMINWLHDTFPEVLESEGTRAVLDRSLAHRKSLQRPRLMYTHDMEDHFVEMKDDLEKLVEFVADQDKHQVVSICGVKGLGKTNLARRVYIHPKVRNDFNAFAWVSLNQDYQVEDLLQNILNQLDPGALKKSAEEKPKVSEEKKGNLLHGMKKPQVVKKSAEEQEKGVEKKIEGAQEQEKGVEEKKEGAEEKESLLTSIVRIGSQKKSAAEHKKGAEGSLFMNMMRIGAGKKSAVEHKKGAEEKRDGADETKEGVEEKKVGVDETKEGAQEQEKGVEEKKEGAQEHEKGVEEKKRGAEEKGSRFTNIMRIGAGKKSAAEHKKGVEEKKVGVDETKEGAQEQEKGIEEKKGGVDKMKAGVDETKEGAQEQEKGVEEKKRGAEEKKGNLLHGMKKPQVVKKSVEEQEKGVEKKIEGAQEQEKGVEEKKEGAEEKESFLTSIVRIGSQKKSAAEHKKGAEGSLFTNMMIIGAGKKSAVEHKKGAEEKRDGADETKEGVEEKKVGAQEPEKGVEEKKEGAQEHEKGVEEKKRGAEEKGSRFTNIMRIGAGKKSAAEHKKGVEEKKVGVDETKEGAQEQEKGIEEKKGGVDKMKAGVDETKEGAQEQEKGVEEKKRGAEEKGSLFTNIMRIGAGKKSAVGHKKGAEEKKEGVDETKEGAQEQEKCVLEKKEAAEDRGSLFTNIMRIGAGKKGVADHKKGAEEKKDGVDETKEGAQEQQKVVEEKKECGEEKGSLFTNIMRIGAGKKSAAEHKKSAEEKKEGVDEKKEGAEEQDKGTEEKKEGVVKQENGVEEKKEGAEENGSLFTNIMRIGAGKKSAAERKKGAEEIKECVDEKTEGVEEQSKSSEETVMDQLKKILSNQRCFIVIDDVSESSQWDYIKSEFVIKGGVTKFLLTTENNEIAAGVGSSHELRCLKEDEGWELLQKYAFRGKKAPDLGLMPKLGKEMVQQCGGLPSEISRLGRTLSKMSSLSEWHKVNDDVAGYLQGKAEQSEWNERHDEQSDPISYDEQSDPISYDELTYGEKQCFLYLAMFKQDEGVDPEDLSFLWMAEGMVSTDHQLEKTTTEYYLQELASMLHVQVDELSTNMRLSLRKDLREWSLHLGEKEDFRLKVVDFSGGKQPRFDRYTLSDGTRRLVIHFNKLSSPREQDLNATENLRSLLFLNSDREYVNIPVKISDFSEFILLRVLHFVRCKFEGRKLPEGIWKLLNLRYFGVLYCDLDKLPTSITNFRNLQVLNVRSYDDSKIVIPSDICQMKSLKHVRLPSNSDHEQSDKLKLDGLIDLQTLDGFNADIHDLDSLSKLEKLQHLSTRAYSNGSLKSIIKFVKSHGARIRTNLVIEHSCDLTSPEAMPVLEEVLMCPNLNALTFSMVVLPMFPNCGKFASKQLTQIKLIGCKLREDPMEALGKFPDLRKLCLGYGAFVGTKIDICDGGFPSLEYLEFRCLPHLEEWNVDEGAMKKLSTLIVRKCPKLKGIPYELASHKTLNKVEIELPPTALCDGCLKIYNRKLKFVKSLNIRKLDPLHSSGAH